MTPGSTGTLPELRVIRDGFRLARLTWYSPNDPGQRRGRSCSRTQARWSWPASAYLTVLCARRFKRSFGSPSLAKRSKDCDPAISSRRLADRCPTHCRTDGLTIRPTVNFRPRVSGAESFPNMNVSRPRSIPGLGPSSSGGRRRNSSRRESPSFPISSLNSR